MLLLLAQVALADPTVALAPTVGEVRAQLAVLEGRLVDAQALGEAVSRLHNAWAERGGAPDRSVPCDSPVADLAPRSELFGTPWRDAIQLARIELEDLEVGFETPSAGPLLDERDQAKLAALRQLTHRQERAFLEASAWHVRYVAPFVRRCQPALVPAVGLARTEIRAEGEGDGGPVAVAVVGSGRLCAAGGVEVQAPKVVVLDDARACYGTCDCTAVAVAPAAVLGETNDP